MEAFPDIEHRKRQRLELSGQTFELGSMDRKRFGEEDSKAKTVTIAAIESNLILTDKKRFIKATKPFFIIETSLAVGASKTESIEPKTIGVTQGQKAALGTFRPGRLGDLDDVRTYHRKMQRVAALVYTHFRREFGELNASAVRHN